MAYITETLEDIELGADVRIKRDIEHKKDLTKSEVRRLDDFHTAMEFITDDKRQWHLDVMALLLANRPKDAQDFLRRKIEDSQPQWDDFIRMQIEC